MIIRLLFKTSILSIVLLMAFSCNRNAVYDEYQDIDNKSWSRHDIKTFEFEITDTISLHDLYLNIRNTTDYQYSNIYFFISTEFPNGIKFRDTVQCILADLNGKWLGRGLGRIKDNRLLFKKGIRFPMSGVYKMGIEQAMREEALVGVNDVGLKLEKQ